MRPDRIADEIDRQSEKVTGGLLLTDGADIAWLRWLARQSGGR